MKIKAFKWKSKPQKLLLQILAIELRLNIKIEIKFKKNVGLLEK